MGPFQLEVFSESIMVVEHSLCQGLVKNHSKKLLHWAGKEECNWNQTDIGILKSSKTGSALFPDLDICGNRVRKNIGSDIMTYTCKDAHNHSAATYLVIL